MMEDDSEEEDTETLEYTETCVSGGWIMILWRKIQKPLKTLKLVFKNDGGCL